MFSEKILVLSVEKESERKKRISNIYERRWNRWI
jgi:hypothetical protein